ncbi:MAG: acyl carrier protein [bacterium]|jgi:acyl carrier protein|nr:acyl carrier protein [bacterium]MBK7188414.1 acyl carrier protein [bacterium]MBK7770047.1 acyl carrier protein [bacterium]MBK9471468.1 acyl carrier protein [bacterium]MBK9777423.1 acyl carrier protein [bacterium]
MELRDLVRDFIIRNFLFGDADRLSGDSVSLLESGIMDSLGVMELVAFIEAELGLSVPDADLIPQNLDSVDNLVAYVGRRRSVAA